MAIGKNEPMFVFEDLGYLDIDGMHPLEILRRVGLKALVRWLGIPYFRIRCALSMLIPMQRWIKKNRATQSVGKRHLESVLAHTPNDPKLSHADGRAAPQTR
jgi:hypothetical protein